MELYARRQEQQGFKYSPDTIWQKEFEEAFPYEETDDQLRAIEATKKDMESNKIMDRLICGDVGYGKTEIGNPCSLQGGFRWKTGGFSCQTTIRLSSIIILWCKEHGLSGQRGYAVTV